MTKSLADLRASGPQSRPQRSVRVCLAPHLVAEVQSVSTRLDDLEQASRTQPRRQAEPRDSEIAALRHRLEELLDQMAEYEGEMRVTATRTDGEWRRWANEHPARGEDQPGHDRDQRVSAGFCNADDLLDDLAVYVTDWEGQPLDSGDFGKLFDPVIASADKAELARAVVALYEGRLDFPRWRNGLSASLVRSNGSSSHGNSGSVTPDSTAKSPELCSEGSTGTDSPAA